jgi:pyruvate formate-lyase activating enzyme-like uncharacterized protein
MFNARLASYDAAAVGVSFLPKNNVTINTFTACTAVFKFSCKLRNRCKKMKKGLFGWKD